MHYILLYLSFRPERAKRAEWRNLIPHQIHPLLIHRINQRFLLRSIPFLLLLLPVNCLIHIRVYFVVNQFVTIVFLSEAGVHPRAMFCNSSLQIVSHTYVQCGIEIIGHYVCVILQVHTFIGISRLRPAGSARNDSISFLLLRSK